MKAGAVGIYPLRLFYNEDDAASLIALLTLPAALCCDDGAELR